MSDGQRDRRVRRSLDVFLASTAVNRAKLAERRLPVAPEMAPTSRQPTPRQTWLGSPGRGPRAASLATASTLCLAAPDPTAVNRCARMRTVAPPGLPIDEILRIARENGAHDVRVFGSRARGDARPDSDLDLLVRFEKGRSLLDLVGLKLELEDLLGIKVDVVSERGLSPYIRERVLAEARPLAA
jgi:uncharacterized protein